MKIIADELYKHHDFICLKLCDLAHYVCTKEGVPSRIGGVVWEGGSTGNIQFEELEDLERGETHTFRINVNRVIDESDRISSLYTIEKYKAIVAIALHEIGHVIHFEKALRDNENIVSINDYMETYAKGDNIEYHVAELYAEYIAYKYLPKVFNYRLLSDKFYDAMVTLSMHRELTKKEEVTV